MGAGFSKSGLLSGFTVPLPFAKFTVYIYPSIFQPSASLPRAVSSTVPAEMPDVITFHHFEGDFMGAGIELAVQCGADDQFAIGIAGKVRAASSSSLKSLS